MKLLMIHGRKEPDQVLDDWGEPGPILRGVIWVHVTYLTTYTVGFKDRMAMQKAKLITGWEIWDDLTLEMRFKGDLLSIHGAEHHVKYFGDWEIQA